MEKLLTLVVVLSFQSAVASINNNPIKDQLLKKYSVEYSDTNKLNELKIETLNYSGKSVDALIEVMKNGKYPDKNRWVATFTLGQIMGTKASPFIAKFLRHPNWVMRLASLKTLLALKEQRFGKEYAELLADNSYIVRTQALENIRVLKIKGAGAKVWNMLFDKRNYHTPSLSGKKLSSKRSNIIKNIIAAIGDLEIKEAKTPLLKMIQKDKYNDIFLEMDSALSKITKTNSGNGDFNSKRAFWKKTRFDTVIQ